MSTVNLLLVDEVKRSDAILSGKILEEHYISKLNFSWWPCMTSVSGFPPRGSRVILVSYEDSANEIKKFALRFSTCDAAVTFVAALKEKLKGLQDVGLRESETIPGTETITRSTVEEPNLVKHLGSYVPEMQPVLEYQDGQILYPPQSTLSQIPNEPFSSLPPSSTTLLSGCFPNSTLGQTTVKQDPGLKSQILEKLKDLEEVGIQERETRSETSFQSNYNPGNEIIPRAIEEEPNMFKPPDSYVPEMQPRLEYQTGQIIYSRQFTSVEEPNMVNHLDSCIPEMQPRLENEELPKGSAALLAKNSQTPRQGGEAVVMEAENLARLTDSQTPLLGGENPELHPFQFSAVTQGKEEIQTPDPMLSPSITPGSAPALTPRTGLTPSRDELHLNEEDMDMDESEELMIGEETEPVAEEENAGMTLVTLKLLCHFKRKMHRSFRDKVGNIMERDGRVSVEVGRRHFEKDYEYLIVSISALEDFEEEISPTLQAARQLFSCCCHCRDKPHLQRLLLGVSHVGLMADRLNSFHTSYIDFVSNGTNQEIFRGIYDGLQTDIAEDHSNMFERFKVELWGTRNEVKSAFEEAIVELRRNCFAFPPN